MSDVFEEIRIRLEEILGVPVSVEHESYTYDTSLPAEDLHDAGVLEETHTKYYLLKYRTEWYEIAEVTYAVFPSENVGYISDLVVNPTVRNEGIGTKITERVTQKLLSETSRVYLCSTSEEMTHISQKQGFKPVEKLGRSWLVLSR